MSCGQDMDSRGHLPGFLERSSTSLIQYNRLPLSVLQDGYLSVGVGAQPVAQLQLVLVISANQVIGQHLRDQTQTKEESQPLTMTVFPDSLVVLGHTAPGILLVVRDARVVCLAVHFEREHTIGQISDIV